MGGTKDYHIKGRGRSGERPFSTQEDALGVSPKIDL